MKKFKNIAVLTSGGDAPGMNAAVRAVVRTAISHNVNVMGIFRGYSGLIDGDIRPLNLRDVSNVINKGGATDLTAHGVPCIGVPCTIDNDIASTDNTIGFDTAMNTVIDLVDNLRDTCESHARCNVVEVMGRGCGEIALSTGIASGATATLIPEFTYDVSDICERIKKARALGKRNFIVIVSEGVGSQVGPELAKTIESETGVETKFARFAHIVRGGSPTLKDRVLASTMGAIAVEELLKGNSNLVICEKKGKIVSVDINYALILDRMYKNKLKDGDLDRFSEKEIERMKKEIREKQQMMARLYGISKTINL